MLKGQLDSLLHTRLASRQLLEEEYEEKCHWGERIFILGLVFVSTHETLAFLQRSMPACGKAPGSATSRAAPLPTKTHCFQLRAWRFGEMSEAQQIRKLCWNSDDLWVKWSRRCKSASSCPEQPIKAVSSKDSWWLSSAVDNRPCLGMQDVGRATNAWSHEIPHVTGGTARPRSLYFPIPQYETRCQ